MKLSVKEIENEKLFAGEKFRVKPNRMLKNKSITRALLFITLIEMLFSIFSFSTENEEKIIKITKVTSPPRIDGILNDDCWKSITPVSGFFQYDPLNGVKASEETFVWTAYDDKNIYFAFQMNDSFPNQIYAELTPRNAFYGNDSITVILDTYYDKRNSIEFTLNPKGIQAGSVETIWHGSAKINEKGWSAEMAIPFKSLRFPKSRNQIWGVNFKRYIHRLREIDYWTKVSRDEPLLLKSGVIYGISDIEPGHSIEFFPYTGYRSSKWEEERDKKFASGFDFKYGITSNLTLDFTVSPDFSEVESDPFIYQLSPYEIMFSEYRPFFSEGSQYFETTYDVFYSRRIENPKLAAKLTGKIKAFSIGILGANNKDRDGDSYFTIFRLKKDLFENSEIGFYFTGLNQANLWNRNAGLDWWFRIKNIYSIAGQTVFSYNRYTKNKNNGLYYFNFSRLPDAGLNFTITLRRIEKDIDIKTGFINQKDYQSLNLGIGYAWRYSKGLTKSLGLFYWKNYMENCSGNPTKRWTRLSFWMDFINESYLSGNISVGDSKGQILKDGSLIWSNAFFPYKGFDLNYSFYKGRIIKGYGLGISWKRMPVYVQNFTALEDGIEKYLKANLSLRPLSFLELSFETEFVEQRLFKNRETVFSGTTYEASLHYQITKSLFFNTRIKGESRYDQYNLDVLLGYYFGAGNIVQLIYKRSSRGIHELKEGGYSIALKASYLLRI